MVNGGKAPIVAYERRPIMRPWSPPRGWTPRRRRIAATAWRWAICPLVSLTILAAAALFAVARADEWRCADSNICFDLDRIVRSTSTPSQMIVLAKDFRSGEGGWVAVDCTARLAVADSPVVPIRPGSPLANLCDTIGDEE